MMDTDNRLKALELIHENCANVTVSIGHVNDDGMVKKDSLYIKDASASCLHMLRDEGYSLSVDERGVRVMDNHLI